MAPVSFVREGSGLLLLVLALAALVYAVVRLQGHDYVAAILLTVTGLFVLRAAVELLRPSVGE